MHQRGSVLFYILIAVALFAALSYAVANMMRTGSVDVISREKTGLMVDEIVDYANQMVRTVQSLRISNGCSDTEISFERSPFDGSDTNYVNANAPSDFSCHIFHSEGGALPYRAPPEGSSTDTEWFIGVNKVSKFNDTQQVGTSEQDLTLILRFVNNNLCDSINDKANGYDVWESGAAHNGSISTINAFDGGYSGAGAINRGNLETPLIGCFCDTSGACTDASQRYFYQVLLAR